MDRLHPLVVGIFIVLKRIERAHLDNRKVIAREAVLGQQLAHLKFHQLKQLFVVNQVGLVKGNNQLRNVHLAGKQNVLVSLRHGAIGRRYHKNGAVHLGSTRNHVFNVVSVTRAVHVSIVTAVRLVLGVGRRNGHTTLALFWSIVDLVKSLRLNVRGTLRKHESDGGSERCLAVVNVPNGAHVYVRLTTVKNFFRHTYLTSPSSGVSYGF